MKYQLLCGSAHFLVDHMTLRPSLYWSELQPRQIRPAWPSLCLLNIRQVPLLLSLLLWWIPPPVESGVSCVWNRRGIEPTSRCSLQQVGSSYLSSAAV